MKYLFAEEIDPTTGEDIAFCMRCEKNGVPVYCYRPEDSREGDTRCLEHDGGGVQGTVGNVELWEFRSRLIHKELGYPYGMDFEIKCNKPTEKPISFDVGGRLLNGSTRQVN